MGLHFSSHPGPSVVQALDTADSLFAEVVFSMLKKGAPPSADFDRVLVTEIHRSGVSEKTKVQMTSMTEVITEGGKSIGKALVVTDHFVVLRAGLIVLFGMKSEHAPVVFSAGICEIRQIEEVELWWIFLVGLLKLGPPWQGPEIPVAQAHVTFRFACRSLRGAGIAPE